MKLRVIFKDNCIENKYHLFFVEFMKFLQNYLPLKKDLDVIFFEEREGKMTTGSRHSNSIIYVLSGKRLNRDILRTIAHEWTHEYQMTILNREKGPDIGGLNEDEANAIAGRLVKMFEKKYPQFISIVYE